MSGSRRAESASTLGILALPALMGAGLVLVDFASRAVVRMELRATADIASAAGASLLDGTAEGMVAARRAAIRAAARNQAGGKAVRLSEEDVDLGFWDERHQRFSPSSDPVRVDTVRVTVVHDEVQASLARVRLAGG